MRLLLKMRLIDLAMVSTVSNASAMGSLVEYSQNASSVAGIYAILLALPFTSLLFF